ncbi:hypothetical protein JKX24_16450 [Serratia proteamaculans]|uniref:DUF551 domain-containing protein n=1 Tax=Serratia proteamaculans TaxID=28151 RepID=A0A7U0N3F3_SERPR|nr:hypothetical protein [Serratia proteamaculans]MBO1505208.1 hypothetical protein [Serratia proteamaculans]QQX51794.1 hypothetical protein JKX24_16450 [Serratia proteamaculans]
MLTTERMAEIAKLAIRLQQISSCAAVTSSGETVLHHTHVGEILSALHDVTSELLANREAQPAGFYTTVSGRKGVVWHNGAPEDDTAIYTAPPAPAVPDEKAITPFFDTLALDTAKMVMCDVNRRSDFLGGDIQLLARIQCRVDEACRAAMLAQSVSQGCKWTYDENDYKWDSGCGEAWMFSDGGPTENGVKFCQSCGKTVLLAAAPEGGNEK